MNKLISWDINNPLWVDNIANWVWVSNPAFLKSKFQEIWLVDGMGWKYNKMVKNLKNSDK